MSINPEANSKSNDSVTLDPTPISQSTDTWAEDEISLFELASTLLEARGSILRSAGLGAVLAVLPVLLAGSVYSSSATVLSVVGGGEGGNAALRGLAQQFGVNVGGGGGGGGIPLASPGILIELASSPVILSRIVNDTLDVPEIGSLPVALIDLVTPLNKTQATAPGAEPDTVALERRRRGAMSALSELVTLSSVASTGALKASVTTPWPSVSFALANRVLEELNRFNREMARGQVSEERRFVEQRIAEQGGRLVQAEERLSAFLVTNRQFQSSPELVFEHDRLQRELALQQQVLVSLTESQEDVRLREVRNYPALRVIEPPVYPLSPDPKGSARRAALGLIAGGMIGVLMAFVSASMQRRRREGDPEAERFMMLARETLRPLTRIRGRS